MQDNFLTPNSLKNTSFPATGPDQQIPAPFAEGYTWVNEGLLETTQDNMSAHVAEGNVISTPHDLARWAKLLYSGKAGLDPEYVALMIDLKPTGEAHLVYGLGTEYTSGLGYGHNGGHAGYLTVMRYDPLTEVAVLLFASVINADDLLYQGFILNDIGITAKQMLGY